MIVGLCQRFGCLPSQLRGEDAELIRMLKIIEMGTPAGGGADSGE